MLNAPKAAFWLGAVATFAFTGCSNTSRVLPASTQPSSAMLVPAAIHYAKPRTQAPAVAPAFFHTPYLGGAVIVNPKFYFVFWGYRKYGDPHKVKPLLLTYAKNMGGSAHNNIETQYYQDLNSVTTFITNPSNQFGGSWDDESPVPKVPNDANISAEALNAVTHFGYDPNGVYFVATPPGRSEEAFPAHYCAYHSVAYYKKKPAPYAYLPYMPDGGAGCGAGAVKPPHDESSADEGVTIMAGHEFGEAITDPSPSTAWDGPEGEIADQCSWHGIANEPFGTKSYTMQPMASNADDACVQSYGSQALPPKSDDLLYLTDVAKNDVEIFSYPQAKHVSKLAKLGVPRAECADAQGNVWIADTQGYDVVEYPHGASKPIAELSTPGAPLGCSVDSKGNNLAVTGGRNGIVLAVYHRRAHGDWRDPKTYVDATIKHVAFCGFDSKGNLFIDGTGMGGAFQLAELPRGGTALVDIAVSAPIIAPGQVQWDGTNLAVGDAGATPSVIYQLSVSGSTAGTVGTTTLDGTKSVRQFSIEGSQVIGPDFNAAVGIWEYPAGGNPVTTITSVRGYGAAVSAGTGSERK